MDPLTRVEVSHKEYLPCSVLVGMELMAALYFDARPKCSQRRNRQMCTQFLGHCVHLQAVCTAIQGFLLLRVRVKCLPVMYQPGVKKV